ncbi:MAG: nucleotidyltransferase family protein [Bacteroidales bacterium]|nr:nucleotidyltransferase family protein [Bacteroidales bacterium]
MEAIILAGGMGTRLREVITDVPKPMAPVNGKPFLYYLFKWIKQYPVDKLVLSAGYKSERIVEYFGNSIFNIPLEYVVEGKPLGTGGAVKYALQKTKGRNILILNGDTYFPINLNKFLSFHNKNNSLFTVALKRMRDFDRYGTVECTGNKILKFNEKRFCKDGLINGGIYLVNRQFIESRKLPSVFSLEKEILEQEAGTSLLKGLVFDELFIDIGIPEDYNRAELMMKNYY